jgi:hypothetical protein
MGQVSSMARQANQECEGAEDQDPHGSLEAKLICSESDQEGEKIWPVAQ